MSDKESTNLYLSGETKALAETLFRSKKVKSLSELFTKLISEEQARDAKADATARLTQLEKDVAELKEAAPRNVKKKP